MLNYFLLGFLLVFVYMIGCQADQIAKPLLFHPTKFPTGYWNDRTISCQEIGFANVRNETLHGWYFPL